MAPSFFGVDSSFFGVVFGVEFSVFGIVFWVVFPVLGVDSSSMIRLKSASVLPYRTLYTVVKKEEASDSKEGARSLL